MAQLAEQLICNQQVFGSSPNIGSRSNAKKGFCIFRASLLAKENMKIFFHTAEQLTEQPEVANVGIAYLLRSTRRSNVVATAALRSISTLN